MDPGHDIFHYLDYRLLLRDYYAAKKSEGRGFSYRAFAMRAGMKSPNHLKRVMEGDRNLSEQSTGRYVRALGLSGQSADYFRALVRFNQATSAEDRKGAYQQVRTLRARHQPKILNVTQAEYFSHWYVPTIREMVNRPGFRLDPHWIASQLRPAITTDEAKQALDILFGLGMLVIDENQTVSQAEPVLSSGGPARPRVDTNRYQAEMLENARGAVEGIPRDQRLITGLTFCVSKAGLGRIRKEILRFQSELVALISEEAEGEELVQLGIQLFPLAVSPEVSD